MTAGFAEFAKAHGLSADPNPELPSQTALLTEPDLEIEAAATGTLPGGEPGIVCQLSYSYRSNDTTHTARRTTAVIAVRESIGFAPYLAGGHLPGIGGGRYGPGTKKVEAGEAGDVRAAEGIDDAWLTELFSPALAHWLARSPEDFEWELDDGALAVSREGHLDKESELTRLCEDAAHLAAALRTESLEEVDSGGAVRTAAKSKPDPQRLLVERMLPLVGFDEPPADVAASRARFRELVVRHPSTWFIAAWMTIVWTVVINVVGGGIFGLLLNLPDPGRAVLIFEVCVIAIVGFLTVRHEINDRSQRLSVEAFWREYARARGLRAEDPGTFAATHAKAELPGNPSRVLRGSFDGVEGALMVTGEGFKRGDTIALVAGPTGPVASTDFDVSAPGASIGALDAYATRLAAELELDVATAPTGARS